MQNFKYSIIFLQLFAVSIFAQVQEKPPLSLSLTPKVQAGCVGGNVSFTETLKNISDKPVVIDPNGMAYSGTLMITEPDRGPKGWGGASAESSIGDVGSGYEPKYKLLWPGETLRRTVTRTLEKKYLGRTVEYQIVYGQFIPGNLRGIAAWRGSVDSNKVKLVAKNCR
jgi:hypothetical protein